jgi:hypothetical protein
MVDGLVLKVGWAFSSRLSMYDSANSEDVFRIALEVIVILAVIGFFLSEIREMCDVGISVYMSQVFNAIGFFNLIFISLAMVIHIWFMFSFVSRLDLSKETHAELYPALEWWAVKKNLAGGTLMLGYLRLFRYLELNARVKVLIYALMNSLEDLATSLMVLVILILAFSLCGMLLFGENVSDFSGFGFAVSTLMRALINDFDYEQLRYFHPSMAPAFYGLYVLLILIVVFNMVIAVIIDGFEEAKNIILHQKFDKNLNRAPFVMSRTKFWRNKMWLFINECTLRNRSTRGSKKEKKEKKQSSGSGKKGRGDDVELAEDVTNKDLKINVKVHPVVGTSSGVGGKETKVDEKVGGGVQKQEGEGEGEGIKRKGRVSLKRAASKKDIMISSLASFHHPQQLKMENLVEHVSTAKDTLRPAHHLKNLFKGHVESNFRKMYAMSECLGSVWFVVVRLLFFFFSFFLFFFFLFFFFSFFLFFFFSFFLPTIPAPSLILFFRLFFLALFPALVFLVLSPPTPPTTTMKNNIKMPLRRTRWGTTR